MPDMQWSDKLELGLRRMDDTHREFVDLYNQVLNAAPEAFVERMDAFIAHTVEHFEQENRWMEKVDFPACHRAEHDRVLVVLRDVRERVLKGDTFLGRRLVEELPAWFENHAGGMDAALAFHLQSIGFDTETETFVEKQDGCGGKSGGGCACASLSSEDQAAA
jgi:hemerythrin